MEQKELVTKLKRFRQEFDDILEAEIPAALLISDLCDALGLSQKEHDAVLGAEAAEAIEKWKSARVWMPADSGRETATVPMTRLAAVPA